MKPPQIPSGCQPYEVAKMGWIITALMPDVLRINYEFIKKDYKVFTLRKIKILTPLSL